MTEQLPCNVGNFKCKVTNLGLEMSTRKYVMFFS